MAQSDCQWALQPSHNGQGAGIGMTRSTTKTQAANGVATPTSETASTTAQATPRGLGFAHPAYTHRWAVVATAVVALAAVGVGLDGAKLGGGTALASTIGTPVKSASAAATGTGTLTAAQLRNATLPAGICGTDPNSAAIKLTNGSGQTGTNQFSPGYWSASVLGSPAQVDFGSGLRGIAASIVCNQGGTIEWSNVWVFGGSPTHLTIEFGPIPQRSYSLGSDGSDFNDTQSTNVRSVGHSMVVSETYGAPDACGGDAGPCPPRHTSTTWSWSAATPHRLVITNPRPMRTVALVRSVPSGIGGDRLTGRSVQAPLQPGHSVLVVCAVTQLSGLQTKKTGLIIDTGAWLPSVDLKPVDVPDCDAISTRSATTTTTAGNSGATGPSSQSVAPCIPTALTSAAQAAGGEGSIDPQGYGCSGDWAYAGVVLEGGQEEVTWIFESVGGAWQRATVQVDCANETSTPAVPQMIIHTYCNSN